MSTPTIDGPRACTKAELPQVIALVDEAMRQGTDQTMLTDYPLVYRAQNLPNVQILKVDGQVVSVVPFIPRAVVMEGCRFTVGIISPTATAPAHRCKGYGLSCLKRCLALMEQAGIELSVLWTDVPTFRFYEHGDYQAVRSQGYVLSCSRQDADLFVDHGDQVVERDSSASEYLTDIQPMHEREVYGVLRSPEEYCHLLALPEMKTLVALRDDRPVAYLVVSEAINKPGLLEGGGEEAALETLVHRALTQLRQGASSDVWANLSASVVGDLLQRKMPARGQPSGGHMMGHTMIRINDVRGFLTKVTPWLAKGNARAARAFSIGVTDANETISFEFSADGLTLGANRLDPHLQIARRELTSVIFGAHPERPVTVPEPVAGLFPCYFPIWVLDRS